jgi:transcriptional regulator with XRE-family HTH domain
MNDDDTTLGVLLRSARERLSHRDGVRVRQADVAERADITVEWYARIERGAVVPSFAVLSRIAAALRLSSQERVEVLRFVVPDLFGRDHVGPAFEPIGRVTRELRAFRRFQRQAESASTPHELVDLAAMSIMDGLPDIAYSSVMSQSASNNLWLHRSPVRPDVAETINRSSPLDKGSIVKAHLEQDGLHFVGSSDYTTTWSAYWRERNAQTGLRSGFGVRVPLTDSFVGYCRTEPEAPSTSNILFLTSIASVLALTMRGSGF